jgi:hypothetical protein
VSSALLRKYAPAPDGFFVLDPSDDDRRAQLAAARAAVTLGASEHVEQRLDLATAVTADGVYALTRADARHMNAALDLPEQPTYDWSEFRDPDEDD